MGIFIVVTMFSESRTLNQNINTTAKEVKNSVSVRL
jgi:hypothetical protein